mgnify:CR=1 FL=1
MKKETKIDLGSKLLLMIGSVAITTLSISFW